MNTKTELRQGRIRPPEHGARIIANGVAVSDAEHEFLMGVEQNLNGRPDGALPGAIGWDEAMHLYGRGSGGAAETGESGRIGPPPGNPGSGAKHPPDS